MLSSPPKIICLLSTQPEYILISIDDLILHYYP